jgi:hypothetical protein
MNVVIEALPLKLNRYLAFMTIEDEYNMILFVRKGLGIEYSLQSINSKLIIRPSLREEVPDLTR